jgi:hypothetical protein
LDSRLREHAEHVGPVEPIKLARRDVLKRLDQPLLDFLPKD